MKRNIDGEKKEINILEEKKKLKKRKNTNDLYINNSLKYLKKEIKNDLNNDLYKWYIK